MQSCVLIERQYLQVDVGQLGHIRQADELRRYQRSIVGRRKSTASSKAADGSRADSPDQSWVRRFDLLGYLLGARPDGGVHLLRRGVSRPCVIHCLQEAGDDAAMLLPVQRRFGLQPDEVPASPYKTSASPHTSLAGRLPWQAKATVPVRAL